MALMPPIEPSRQQLKLSPQQQCQLLQLARRSIEQGLQSGTQLQPRVEDFDPDLQQPAACFVTLTMDDGLRGCVGTLEPSQSLLQAVAHYAYSAAFADSRFRPLTAAELARTRIEISVLSPLQGLEVASEAELAGILRPGIDGLWLQIDQHRATFLPQVWEKLPKPEDFIQQLKLKAGLSRTFWSKHLNCRTYTVFSMFEPPLDRR